MATPQSTTSVAFFGATGGCVLSTLRRSLAAGYTCVALARTPAKLEALVPLASNPTFTIKEGNAKKVADVSACLTKPSNPTAFVDHVVFGIGGAFQISQWGNDDPEVCRTAMATLLSAIAALRSEKGVTGRPHITAVSTTGISQHGRDVPALFVPLYHVMLRGPHEDKRDMEEQLIASGEVFTIVRPSLLNDGETQKEIRVGVEDPAKGWESKALGYFISREDVGRWIFEKCVTDESQYVGKAVTLTT